MAILEADFTPGGMAAAGFAPLLTKLRPPRPSLDLVERTSLLNALHDARTPLIVVSGPAGSGKTITLTQWADREPHPVAWLTLDAADNDPLVLLTYLALVLRPLISMDPELTRWLQLTAPPVQERILPAFAEALSDAPPFRLIVDDAHVLTNSLCWQIVDFLIAAVPADAQIALGSRNEPALPLARLRAGGRSREFGPADLNMDVDETAELLRLHGIQTDEATVVALQASTEGWATGIYLAALAVEGRSPDEWLAGVRGHQRDIARYLAAEVLERQPDELREFLLQTSILERLSAGLCRAVTGKEAAGTLLARLARSNLFVSSLDDHDEWYRYHHLFAEFLRAELERQGGEQLDGLSRRAAEWCEEHGLLEEALRHWLAVGEVGRAAAIVCRSYMPYAAHGRGETVRRWLELFTDEQILSNVPLTLTAGWMASMSCDQRRARLWSAALSERVDDSPSPDGASSLRSSQAALRAGIGADGVSRMRADAALAASLEADGHPTWQAGNETILGVACWLAGDRGEAKKLFRRAAEKGATYNVTAEIGALGYLSHVFADEGDWVEAERYAALGQHCVNECAFARATSLGVLLAQARVHAHQGDPGASQEIEAIAAMLAQITPPPWVGLSSAVLLAETHIELGDLAAAGRWRKSGILTLAEWPDAGILRERLDELRRTLQERGGLDPLTRTEERVLKLLPTRLTEKAMARELEVSPNTVKSHVQNIYRKLSASTRADAVQRAHELGLLEK